MSASTAPTPPSSQASPSNVVSMRAPEKVYAAWTDPAQIVKWFGPDGGRGDERRDRRARRRTLHHRSSTPRTARSTTSAASIARWCRTRSCQFTWAWRSTPERESLVTILIKPDGDGSILTLIHEQFFDEAARDRHEYGWTGALDKLEKLFA